MIFTNAHNGLEMLEIVSHEVTTGSILASWPVYIQRAGGGEFQIAGATTNSTNVILIKS